jgi:hypothetical protein
MKRASKIKHSGGNKRRRKHLIERYLVEDCSGWSGALMETSDCGCRSGWIRSQGVQWLEWCSDENCKEDKIG